jgi:glycosyltransferase involved in cell wall biosynthesis
VNIDTVTPLILTYNEAPNIARTIDQLNWAQEIIVLDSYSTDETINILGSYPQVKIFQRVFDTHATQWNYGLEQIKSGWVLSLDADYFVTDHLVEEIISLNDSSIDGYFIPFKYCVFGKPLRGTILPPRQMLFRKEKSTYIDDGHTQLLVNKGSFGQILKPVYHDDRKPLSRWLWAQDRYLLIEANKLLDTPETQLSFGDRIRKQKILAPFIILIYCLILKGGILDGWQGWHYAFQRVLAEILLSIRIIEVEKLKSKP